MTDPMTPPDPVPTAEDYRRADLLIKGAGEQFDSPALRDLFAGGIAVARTGTRGDVLDYLRRQLTR